MTRRTFYYILGGSIAAGTVITGVGIHQYNVSKDRSLKERYYAKLSSDQVKEIEMKKYEVEQKQIERDIALANAEKARADEKKNINNFKAQVTREVTKDIESRIKGDMRSTFDSWHYNYESKIESKLTNMDSRIDKLSDSYGGVKQSNGTAGGPTISVVNAPAK